MNKNDKYIDDFTKNMIKEVELDTPSSAFLDNVMNKISIKPEQEFVYKPLISKKNWYSIFLIIVIISFILYLFPFVNESYITNWNYSFRFSFSQFIPNISFSKSIIYVIGFLIIFFVEIYYLKLFINKSYVY